MKKILLKFFCLILGCFALPVQSQDSMSINLLSPEEMQADFDSLCHLLHSTHTALFAFADKEDWNQLKQDIRDSLNRPLVVEKFYRVISPLVSSLKDIHTRIFLNAGKSTYYRGGGYYLPLHIRYIGGKVYVLSSKDSVLEKGSELLAINNLKAKSVVERMIAAQYEDGDGRHTQVRLMESAFTFALPFFAPIDSMNRIIYRPPLDTQILQKEIKGQRLKRPSKKERKESRKEEKKAPVFTLEPVEHEAVAHLKIRSFSRGKPGKYNRFLKKTFRRFSKNGTQHLILDLRNNTGGYLSRGVRLVSYIMPDSFTYVNQSIVKGSPLMKRKLKKTFWLPKLAFKFLGKEKSKEFRLGWHLPLGHCDTLTYKKYPPYKEKLRFKGNVWVLINSLSASNSVLVHHALSYSNRAVSVGEASAGTANGTFGNSLHFELEHSQISGRVSSLQIFTREIGDTIDPHPLAPDFLVLDSIEDIIEGKDTQLDYVLKKIGEGNEGP